MVKKLIKHEFVYYYRSLAILLPAVILVGAVTRFFIFLTSLQLDVQTEDMLSELMFIAANIGLSSVIMIQVVGSFALLLFAWAMGIIRFYKNMYTAEGYLTFTLPVNNHQHILVKLFVMLTAQLATAVAVLIGATIALSGKPLTEMLRGIGEIFSAVFSVVPPVHMVFYIIEALLLLLVAIVSSPLLYYACITLGQTAKKNQILMAIGAYFLYYVATQVLSSVLMVFSLFFSAFGIFDWIGNFIVMHPFASVHIIFTVIIIVNIAIAVLYYFVTHRIMTKKLNLE